MSQKLDSNCKQLAKKVEELQSFLDENIEDEHEFGSAEEVKIVEDTYAAMSLALKAKDSDSILKHLDQMVCQDQIKTEDIRKKFETLGKSVFHEQSKDMGLVAVFKGNRWVGFAIYYHHAVPGSKDDLVHLDLLCSEKGTRSGTEIMKVLESKPLIQTDRSAFPAKRVVTLNAEHRAEGFYSKLGYTKDQSRKKTSDDFPMVKTILFKH